MKLSSGMTVAAAVIMLAVGSDLAAQCPGGAAAVGDLGIELLACDCTLSAPGSERPWVFRSDAEVLSVRRGSPADGQLQPGDVLVAVNGHALGDRAGADALARVDPGQTITLTVRRGDEQRIVQLQAVSACPTDRGLLGTLAAPWRRSVTAAAAQAVRGERGVAVAGAAPAAAGRRGAVAGEAPAAAARRAAVQAATPTVRGGAPVSGAAVAGAAVARAPVTGATQTGGTVVNLPAIAAAPSAWLGLAYSCTDCTFVVEGDTRRWSFSTAPEVYSVDPGSPAHAAGMRRGDVVTHVDGHSITSAAGGRRWSTFKPGEVIRLQYRRGGVSNTVELRADPVPERPRAPTVAGAATMRSRSVEAERLRFSGSLGNAEVEVRGLSSVVVTEQGNELVITTPEATIRIRVPPLD